MVRGQVFASEHGEIGGDEINTITSGANFGFPYFCSGGCLSYENAKPLGDVYKLPPEELEIKSINSYIRPLAIWNTEGTPIEPSGIVFYPFNRAYKDNLIVAGLKSKTLFRFLVDDNLNLKLQSPIMQGLHFRDVAVDNKGFLYILANLPASSVLYKVHPPSLPWYLPIYSLWNGFWASSIWNRFRS